MRASRRNRDEKSPGHPISSKNPLADIELVVGESTYRRLVDHCQRNSLPFEDGVRSLLERGMENYWLMAYKSLKQDLAILEEDFKRYKRDYELLDAIEKQNEELDALLRSKGIQVQSGRDVR